MEGHPNGWEVTRLRRNAGLSARQLATRAGVSTSSVARAEHGRSVTRDVLAKLADVLGPGVYEAVPVWPPVRAGALAQVRARTGESLRQAAKRAGVSADVFNRAECGKGVHPGNAKKIADAFGLHVDDVLPVPVQGEANRHAA